MTSPAAEIVIKVYPIGEPGKVGLIVEQKGPVVMTPVEVVNTLRSAETHVLDQQRAGRL
jgi:hypothetical protein